MELRHGLGGIMRRAKAACSPRRRPHSHCAALLQWFRDRLVWSDPATVHDLLKKGLAARLYEPQVGGECGRAQSGA